MIKIKTRTLNNKFDVKINLKECTVEEIICTTDALIENLIDNCGLTFENVLLILKEVKESKKLGGE